MSTPTALRPGGALRGARITGTGSYRPGRVVSNAEICEHIDSTDEWIRERSGIEERRWVGAGETVVSMATIAARRALEDAGVRPDQLGAILLATVSHEMATPAAAPMLAAALGCHAPAMDLSAACAGYCHGIALAADMIASGTAEHVLVLGVESIARLTDPTDRGSAFIFGDAAGAAVVSHSEVAAIGPTIWGSLGEKWEYIRTRGDGLVTMNGPGVFRWAVWDMVPVARRALEAAGVTAADLDVFIPHQANLRITSELAKQLKLPEHVVVSDDIRTTGNTSAASVPVATDRMRAAGLAKSGDLALQMGFGAGLVYAAQVVRLP